MNVVHPKRSIRVELRSPLRRSTILRAYCARLEMVRLVVVAVEVDA